MNVPLLRFRYRKPLAACGLGVALVMTSVAPADAYDAGLAHNEADAYSWPGHTVNRASWDFAALQGPEIAAFNHALASARASYSTTTAVAFQVVTASVTDELNVSNTALTSEVGCTQCNTEAIAVQWIVASPSDNLSITPAGDHQLDQIARQLWQLNGSWATQTAVETETSELEAEVDGLLAADVVASPPQPWGHRWGSHERGPGARSDALEAPAALAATTTSPQPQPSATSAPVAVMPENGYTIYQYGQVSAGTPSVAPTVTTTTTPLTGTATTTPLTGTATTIPLTGTAPTTTSSGAVTTTTLAKGTNGSAPSTLATTTTMPRSTVTSTTTPLTPTATTTPLTPTATTIPLTPTATTTPVTTTTSLTASATTTSPPSGGTENVLSGP